MNAECSSLNLFDLPEGNIWEQLGAPDAYAFTWLGVMVLYIMLLLRWVMFAHYNFMTAMIDGGLKQLAVIGTMHEVGYWEGVIDENTLGNSILCMALLKMLFVAP